MSPSQTETKKRGLTDTLRESTAALRRRAERSGIVADILRGKVSVPAYALFLRNLHAIYAALEAGFARQKSTLLRAAAPSELQRAEALAADLDLLSPEWRDTPLLSAGEAYRARVAKAATGSGRRLLAHAYVRYSGDIGDRPAHRRMLQRSSGIPTEALSFYRYPRIEALDIFERRYRESLDAAFENGGDMDVLIAEAVTAAGMDIALSEAARNAAVNPPPV